MDNPTKYEHPDFFLFLNLYFFFGDCETRGIVERKSRPSSKHPDKEKLFWSLTEKGLQFGKNLTDPNHPRQTQPHFYDSQFPRLLSVMMNGIAAA
ncbi:hypothetical protein [Arsenophonus sp. PmNCSU2021_1]|uniref:hypothetical protein n=1 Tax=Arsenophonus sp. PmNCSU2021_1 TaxID=3118989 RepID=UPI002FF09F42